MRMRILVKKTNNLLDIFIQYLLKADLGLNNDDEMAIVENTFEFLSKKLLKKNFNVSKWTDLPTPVQDYLLRKKCLDEKEMFDYFGDKQHHSILNFDILSKVEVKPIHKNFYQMLTSYEKRRADFELKKGNFEWSLLEKILMSRLKVTTADSKLFYRKTIQVLTKKEYEKPERSFTPHQYKVKYCCCGGNYKFYCDENDKICECGKQLTKNNSVKLLDICDQIAMLLSRPEIEQALLLRQKENTKDLPPIQDLKNHEIRDVYDSAKYTALRKSKIFLKSDLFLTITLWIDDLVLKTDKGKKKVNVARACINELPPNIRMKLENLLTLMIFQNRKVVNPTTFQLISTQLQDFLHNNHLINYFHYSFEKEKFIKIKKSISVRGMHFSLLKDKGIEKDLLNLKTASGYMSCSTCLIVGKKEGHGNTCFPFRGFDKASSMRTMEWFKLCKRYKKDYEYYGFFFAKLILLFI